MTESPPAAAAGAPDKAARDETEPAAARQNRPGKVRTARELRLLANRLLQQDKLPEAIAALEAYLLLVPEDAGSWCNLGVALRKNKTLEASEAAYRRALELRPNDPAFLGNLANVLKDMDKLNEAIEVHKAARQAKPGDPLLVFNHGLALREAGRFGEALEIFDDCVAGDPENAKYNWDRALALLHLGRMKEGWAAYAWRWKIGELPAPPYDAKPWQGEDLAGKKILLFPEQGFGDTILATRFIPQLKALGPSEVVLECKPPLERLFAELEGVDRMVAPKSELTGFDYHCSLMNLLVRFEAGVEALPPPPRLTIPQAARDKIAPLIARSGERFKVGVVWSGSVTFKNNRKRAVQAGRFLALAKQPGVQFYSLQKGPTEGQLREIGAGAMMIDLGRRIEDFAETAAAIEALDLVIMTDSAVAHLAGSLGQPVWDLLNHTPYWLYGQTGESTPWYPSMRLFRQPTPSDWDSVFAAVGAALAEAVEAKQAGRWPSPR